MSTLLKQAIKRFRNIKREQFLNKPLSYLHNYAIIGTGQHSINHLYPCLWHLGVPIKMIYSNNAVNAKKAALRWQNCLGTNNLNEVLDDQSIKGVIVCTSPEHHASIAKQLLQSKKHVFIEKPVGFSINELQDIIPYQESHLCQIGLQRRFAPITKKLKKLAKNPVNYNYRFLLGPYPEGEVLYDLFIHPIDIVIQLFGSAKIAHAIKIERGQGITYEVLLNHGDIYGYLELSTDYGWQSATDELIINTKTEILTACYPNVLTSEQKPVTIFNIPVEKVFPKPLTKRILMNHSFLPIQENNSLSYMGFYPQLAHFVSMVESGQRDPLNNLEKLLPTYQVLEQLKTIR